MYPSGHDMSSPSFTMADISYLKYFTASLGVVYSSHGFVAIRQVCTAKPDLAS